MEIYTHMYPCKYVCMKQNNRLTTYIKEAPFSFQRWSMGTLNRVRVCMYVHYILLKATAKYAFG